MSSFTPDEIGILQRTLKTTLRQIRNVRDMVIVLDEQIGEAVQTAREVQATMRKATDNRISSLAGYVEAYTLNGLKSYQKGYRQEGSTEELIKALNGQQLEVLHDFLHVIGIPQDRITDIQVLERIALHPKLRGIGRDS